MGLSTIAALRLKRGNTINSIIPKVKAKRLELLSLFNKPAN
jgi:hypothetical protein